MDNKDFWKQILLKLYPSIRHDQFITWFADTAVLRIDSGVVVIGVPTQFAFNWIEQYYKARILEAAIEFNKDVTDVSFVVDSNLSNKDDPRKFPLASMLPNAKKAAEIAGETGG